ncbi:protein FdhD like protein [Flavobacteriaceae bacterium UJ101]|nr:protein FdhD like protein [Flavobacteriaceae bacterium UJ101]
MKESLNYEGIRVSSTSSEKIEDTLAVEAALQININDEPYTVVMRTPGQDYELIRGLLYAEDIYKEKQNLDYKIIEESENGFSIINVTISNEKLGKGFLNKRTLLSVSSCGICGKQKIEDLSFNGRALENEQLIDLKEAQKLFSMMKQKQNLFLKTGGTHAAAVFDQKNQFLILKEDIGRHNAVDKVIGNLLNQQEIKKAHILLVSGRVSYEILSKAFIAKIPFVIAVSACSSLAVDYAKELGICLIGFSRDDKATIYANPHYVVS